MAHTYTYIRTHIHKKVVCACVAQQQKKKGKVSLTNFRILLIPKHKYIYTRNNLTFNKANDKSKLLSKI